MSTEKRTEPQTQAIGLIGESSEGIYSHHCRPYEDQTSKAETIPTGRSNNQPQPLTTRITTRTDGGSSGTEASSSSSLEPRLCSGTCGQQIPAKRLAVRPNARMCVPCQEAAGDIPPILRFDEYGVGGDKLETYFSTDSDPRLTRYMTHLNTGVPDDLSFDYAVGDDSHLIREGDSVIDVARPLASEFEDEVEARFEPLQMAA